MLKRCLALFLLSAAPAFGALIDYDYSFDYYDISDCATGCSPTAESGQGSLTVDTDGLALLNLNLFSDRFNMQWQGRQSFDTYDIWTLTEEGKLHSLGTEIDHSGYVASLYLDLFFVPDDANPMWHLENVSEQHNTLSDGRSTWALFGRFTEVSPIEVPEPASWLLFLAGLIAVGGLGRRSGSLALRQRLSGLR